METRRMVDTEVGSLAVRECGQGPAAVLWHSLFVDDRSWGRVETVLGADRRLVIVTGPGHGASTDPGRRYTLQECAAAARTVLDALGVEEPVDWLGNAWGGHVGVLFAARWPARCRTLVTLGTPVQALDAVERARTYALLLAYRVLGPARFIRSGVAEVLLSAGTRERDSAAVAMVEECIVSATPSALRNAVVSISLRRPGLEDVLTSIAVPTLFVTGADHTGWTPVQARDAAALLPQGAWAEVPDAAYLVPLEAPEETVRLVREFWSSHVPR